MAESKMVNIKKVVNKRPKRPVREYYSQGSKSECHSNTEHFFVPILSHYGSHFGDYFVPFLIGRDGTKKVTVSLDIKKNQKIVFENNPC